jgi:hypothetical protein
MKDTKLYNLLEDFVFNALPVIDEAIEKRYFKPKYDKYPNIKYRDNGMPDIGEYGDTPIKISDLFHSYSGKPDVVREDLIGYTTVFEYLKQHKEFKEYNYFPHGTQEQSDNFFETTIYLFIIDILERYYLVNKEKKNDKELLTSIYVPLENYIYAEKLEFDIAAPILFTKFDFEEYSINENMTIRKISDEYNKARISIRSYSPPVTTSLISSASHELVLRNYSSKKPKKFVENLFSEESVYPHDKLETFFNALKICSNINTGYAQVIIYPHNWVKSYNMDLPYITGTSVKRYPNWFDNFYWNTNELPSINKEQVEDIKEVYLNFLTNQNNKIKIASKRLRYSYLRDNEEDSILDILIALETLLSDGDKGEITHKLSLRIAKLLDLFTEEYDPIVVFDSMKNIYAFRSAIVHGSSKIEYKREIKIPNISKPISTISLANDYLRSTLKILTKNPLYLDPKEIDKLLIRNTLPNTRYGK